MKIVLCGGGTAGHVMPNIALIPNLKDRFGDILYLGRKDGVEEKLASAQGIPFFPVPAVKLDRSKRLPDLAVPIKLASCVVTARKLLAKLLPDVVFAKGGYASLPVALAARTLRIPVVCHESDFSLGLANKLISKFAVCTMTSFSQTRAPRAYFVGNPVRASLTLANAAEAERLCNFSRKAKTVLFVGGSSGAAAINKAVDAALPSLVSDYNVVHICGACNLRPNSHGYRCIEFADNIFDFYALADVVVSRSGANCASELAAMGKRVIFIPLPKGASRGDQIENAQAYADQDRAVVLPQQRLNTYELVCAIGNALSRPAPPPDPAPLAASAKIADKLAEIARAKYLSKQN